MTFKNVSHYVVYETYFIPIIPQLKKEDVHSIQTDL